MKITLNNSNLAGACAMDRSVHSVLAGVVAGLTLLAGLVLMPSAAKAQQTPTPAVTNWTTYGPPIDYDVSENGPPVSGKDTSNQLLTTNLSLQVYKSSPTNDGLDWYLVAGPYYQSVTNSNSKGWIGVAMDLNIVGQTAPSGVPATLYDAQPATTTLTDESTTSIGATLGFSSSGPVPGIGRTYSVTDDAPSVVVGTTNAGNTANFNFSYDNTSSVQVQYAAIFNVPHGQGLQIQITPWAWWTYTKSSSTNQTTNLYAQGSLIADFGAAPSGSQPATGVEIVNSGASNGLCMTSAPEQISHVKLLHCDSRNQYQHWYYNGGQVVNAASQSCLDIDARIGQGGTPPVGAMLMTNSCDSNLDSQTSWQLTTTKTSGSLFNLRGMDGYIATPAPGGYLVLGAPGSSNPNTAFFLQ